MASGDLAYFEPGSTVDVVVEADGEGNVPTYGDLVEPVDQSRGRVHVSALSGAGNSVGHLNNYPANYDENEDYDAGEVVGESEVLVRAFIDWVYAEDPSELEPGDLVVDDTDGVRAYDDGEEGGDAPETIFGMVWTPHGNQSNTSEKVSVVRFR